MKNNKIHFSQHKEFLDEMVNRYNRSDFISPDPISIPHQYSKKEDIEISGFLTAVIAWGQRPVILKNANRLMDLMEQEPHNFLIGASQKEFKRFDNFVHRTFNGIDCRFFLASLKNLYLDQGGLENVFNESLKNSNNQMGEAIHKVRTIFFGINAPGWCSKHFADPLANSAAKRINMFLRWMVRKDKQKVDFGIWKKISPSLLYCPLDVHSGRVARELGLLSRNQDDWKAVEELTANLRILDANDPVKYDFALFGAGVEGEL
ncbi:MAG TPA: TIGR02757 family protein [Bacteroidia bacterium]|nr:TIGR02757 family protein [Bacteroidia bacterium]